MTFLAMSISMFAQSNIKIDFKDTSLKAVMESVAAQSRYKFVYTGEINIEQKITVKSENESIDRLLNKIFSPLNITYTIRENQIVLSLKQVVHTKTPTFTGIITDDENFPLPGVAIKNETTGAITVSNLDGRYTIEAREGDVLAFSMIGMETSRSQVGKSSVINVSMKVDVILLEDLVVTGYQTLSKERATGSYSIIKSEQISKPSSSIAERIIGTTSGLQSKTDAEGNISFEIRGKTSLLASQQPLLVVDGFPTQDDFNSINPNDVESITILKDAAAASIWGAKSANGVIVVVTKKGADLKKGEVRVDFQSFWKVSPKIDWSYANPSATSSETVEYEKTFFNNGAFSPNIDNYTATSSTSLAVMALNENHLGYLTTNEMNARLDYLSGLDNSNQIRDYMLGSPFTQQYNLSVMTSTEKATNVLSVMYENQDKYLQGNSQNKYNFSAKSDVRLLKWLDFNISGNLTINDSKNNAITYSRLTDLSPYQMLINEDGTKNTEMTGYADGNFGTMQEIYSPTLYRHINYTAFPYSDWTYNPITEREGRDYSTLHTSIKGQSGLLFKIVKGFTVETKGQYERIENYTRNINDETTALVRNFINQTSTYNPTTRVVKANLPKGSIMDQNKSVTSSYNWRNQLNFNRSFDEEKHQINFIAGMEISSIITQTTKYGRTYGYNDKTLTVGTYLNGLGGSGNYKLTGFNGFNLTFKDYMNTFTYFTEKYFSAYANLSYSFLKKYTLSASARTDASNLITDDPAYRYSPFWSVGASWVISEESFLEDMSWLDRLTVRGTYGYNGNVDRSTSFNPLIDISSTLNSTLQTYTASIASYGNPTLRWEKTGTFDFGIDYSVLKGKIFGKLDFYNKKGKDLIVSMSIPSPNGTTSQKLNAAEMTNRGFEFEVGTALKIKDSDILWNGSLNFSYNKNKIDKLFKVSYTSDEMTSSAQNGSSYVEGCDANTLWAFQYNGTQNVGTETNPKFRPSVIDKNGDIHSFNTSYSGDGRDILFDAGTMVAPFTLGFSNSFKIYDFNFSFLLTGKFGHKFRGLSFNYPYMIHGYAKPNRVYSEVLNADPSELAPIPVEGESSYSNWSLYYPYLNYLIQNAGHIRFKEVNLTYNLPSKIANALRMKKANVFAQANNLFIVTDNKYSEDPEYPLGSIKPAPYFSFGFNLTF